MVYKNYFWIASTLGALSSRYFEVKRHWVGSWVSMTIMWTSRFSIWGTFIECSCALINHREFKIVKDCCTNPILIRGNICRYLVFHSIILYIKVDGIKCRDFSLGILPWLLSQGIAGNSCHFNDINNIFCCVTCVTVYLAVFVGVVIFVFCQKCCCCWCCCL